MSPLYPPLGTVPFVVTQGPHTPTQAVDMDAPDGSALYATHSGRLTKRVSHDGGNVVEVTGGDLFSHFFHTQGDAWWRKPDRDVQRGERIATMGATGTPPWGGVYGAHLHWAMKDHGVWTYPPTFPVSLGGAMPVPIVVGQEPRESPFVVDIPKGIEVLDGSAVAYRQPAAVVADYFGNPWDAIELGTVQLRTARITGRDEWLLLYVRDTDVGAPRRKPVVDECQPLRDAIDAAKAALDV